MEANGKALSDAALPNLGERYLMLHRKHFISKSTEIPAKKRCQLALRWSEDNAHEVSPLMQNFLCQSGSLKESANYHLTSEGKLFRARLSLAISKLLELDDTTALQLAAVTEFVHNASLIHDDIQDQDDFRRNQPTVWKRYGTNSALLLGDLLLSKAYEMLGMIGVRHHRGPRLFSLLGEKIALLIQGQSDELEHQSNLELPVATYERIAFCKTGSLLSFPVEAALTLAGNHESHCAAVSNIFGRFGVAYQIHDDLIDLCAPDKQRVPGSDLREGRVSAVILSFWQHASLTEREQFSAFFHSSEQRAHAPLVEFWVKQLAASQALEGSFSYLERTLSSCRTEADALPDPLNAFMTLVVAELEQRIAPPKGDA
jgi:geranylgeranyl pyrophosphate synthase